MELAGYIIAGVCALALGGLAPLVVRAAQRGAPHARLAALSLVVATPALLGAFVALALGAANAETGRFLMGMSVGVAVGLALGCAVLLAVDQRTTQRP